VPDDRILSQHSNAAAIRVIAGLGALATRVQRYNDLTVGRKRLRCQFPDIPHVRWQRGCTVQYRPPANPSG